MPASTNPNGEGDASSMQQGKTDSRTLIDLTDDEEIIDSRRRDEDGHVTPPPSSPSSCVCCRHGDHLDNPEPEEEQSAHQGDHGEARRGSQSNHEHTHHEPSETTTQPQQPGVRPLSQQSVIPVMRRVPTAHHAGHDTPMVQVGYAAPVLPAPHQQDGTSHCCQCYCNQARGQAAHRTMNHHHYHSQTDLPEGYPMFSGHYPDYNVLIPYHSHTPVVQAPQPHYLMTTPGTSANGEPMYYLSIPDPEQPSTSTGYYHSTSRQIAFLHPTNRSSNENTPQTAPRSRQPTPQRPTNQASPLPALSDADIARRAIAAISRYAQARRRAAQDRQDTRIAKEQTGTTEAGPQTSQTQQVQEERAAEGQNLPMPNMEGTSQKEPVGATANAQQQSMNGATALKIPGDARSGTQLQQKNTEGQHQVQQRASQHVAPQPQQVQQRPNIGQQSVKQEQQSTVQCQQRPAADVFRMPRVPDRRINPTQVKREATTTHVDQPQTKRTAFNPTITTANNTSTSSIIVKSIQSTRTAAPQPIVCQATKTASKTIFQYFTLPQTLRAHHRMSSDPAPAFPASGRGFSSRRRRELEKRLKHELLLCRSKNLPAKLKAYEKYKALKRLKEFQCHRSCKANCSRKVNCQFLSFSRSKLYKEAIASSQAQLSSVGMYSRINASQPGQQQQAASGASNQLVPAHSHIPIQSFETQPQRGSPPFSLVTVSSTFKSFRCQSMSLTTPCLLSSQMRRCKKCGAYYSISCANIESGRCKANLNNLECPMCWNSKVCYCGKPFSDAYMTNEKK